MIHYHLILPCVLVQFQKLELVLALWKKLEKKGKNIFEEKFNNKLILMFLEAFLLPLLNDAVLSKLLLLWNFACSISVWKCFDK